MSFDFDAGVQSPFRMQPGLRRLAEGSTQLSPAARDGRHLRQKLAVLDEAWTSALLSAPGFDARPALDALARQAAGEHPRAVAWDGEVAAAHHLGWALQGDEVRECAADQAALPAVGACLRRLPASWRLPALLSLALAEDFAIVDARTARIPWLAVALPSSWVPADKVGRQFAEVHAPVADNHTLLAAADALARLVSGPARWERFVWTITPHPALDAHPARQPKPRWTTGDAEATAAQAWWRTERQTFIPITGAGQAVFTILVDTQPLDRAIDGADKAARVHDALASMSDAVLRYRGLGEVRDPLLRWLARRMQQQ